MQMKTCRPIGPLLNTNDQAGYRTMTSPDRLIVMAGIPIAGDENVQADGCCASTPMTGPGIAVSPMTSPDLIMIRIPPSGCPAPSKMKCPTLTHSEDCLAVWIALNRPEISATSPEILNSFS